MILHDLQENKFSKLQKALSEVFDTEFNFDLPKDKLVRIQESTTKRISVLREKGIDASHKDYQKLLLISEGLKHVIAEAPEVEEEVIEEAADLDQAEVLLAAKQMADDLQKMAETLASMQVEDLMSITNAMKEEVGLAEAEAFEAAAEAAIGGALDAVKNANEQVSNAVLAAQGQAPAPTDMSMDMGPEEPAMDMEVDADATDDFAGADAADEMSDDEGHEMKEEVDPYLSALKKVKEAQSTGTLNKDVLKQAFSSKR